MIEGVTITELRRFPDERGSVMHMLRCDWDVYKDFGEIYFSTVHPGVVKGWHVHHRATLNYAVPVGRIKFVLFDDRENSRTQGEIQEVFLGEDNYVLVTVPPLIWNGFKGIGDSSALVANCASIPHDSNEIDRRDPADPAIPYDWAIKHG